MPASIADSTLGSRKCSIITEAVEEESPNKPFKASLIEIYVLPKKRAAKKTKMSINDIRIYFVAILGIFLE